MEEKIKIKVPFYKQEADYTCGPASLQMVLSFLGIHKSEYELIKQARTSKKGGTRHKWMIDVARKEGFYCYVNNNSTLEEIRHFINLELPVIINYIEPTNNEGHYAVVIGFEGGEIIMNDPWNGVGFRMMVDDFLPRWHGESPSIKNKRWMMVISKDDFGLGRQYLPKSSKHNKKNN